MAGTDSGDAMAESDAAAGGLERKLATILSADVAAYSRLMAEDEERTLQTFLAHPPDRTRRKPRSRWSQGRKPRETPTSKARAGRRTGQACHRRWNAYGKQQGKGKRSGSRRSCTMSIPPC